MAKRPVRVRKQELTVQRPKVRPTGTKITQASAWERLSPRVQHLLCLLFLLGVTLGFFAATTFGGRTLIGGDTVAWQGMAQAMQEYEAETGRQALWSPNLFSGMPGYFIHYPKAVPQIDSVLGALRSAGWWPGAHFLFLLLGTYCLVYYLARDQLAATLAAVAFGLTTYIPLILLAGHNTKFIALAFAPWLVLAFVYTLRRPPDATWKRTLLGAFLFAIALAANIRAGHVQITYYVAFTLGVVWIVEGVGAVREGAWKNYLWATGALAFGSALALLMVAQPLLVQAEYKAFTIRGASEGGGLAFDYAMQWSQGLGELVTLLVPGAYGGEGQLYWGPKPFTAGPHYVGPVVMLLAVLGLYGVRRRVVTGLGIAGGLMVLFALGEHAPWINRPMFELFPLFNAFRVPETWLAAVSLVLAVLAGVGLYYADRREPTPEAVERKTRAEYVTLGVLGGLLLILLLGHDFLFSFERPGELEQIQQAVAQQAGVAASDPRVVQVAVDYLAEVKAERADLFKGDTVRALVFLLLAGGLVVLHRRRRTFPGWALAVGLLLLVTFDLWQVGQRYFNPESPSLRTRSEIAAQIPEYGFDRFIMARVEAEGGPGHFRTLPLALNPFNDARSAYYYESTGGYHGAKLALYQDYIDDLLFNADGSLNQNALDLLSTRYVIARQPLPGMEPVYQDPDTGLLVLENPSALPRAFFVERTEVIEDRDEAIRLLKDPKLDLRGTAILHEEPPVPLEPAPIDTVSTARVSLVRYNPREIVWEVETDRPRLMVASEVYYPAGWNAFVDSDPAPILRANHLLRAVPVPAGRHLVSMRFEPEEHERSILISGLSTAIAYIGALLLAGLLWYRKGG